MYLGLYACTYTYNWKLIMKQIKATPTATVKKEVKVDTKIKGMAFDRQRKKNNKK